MGLPTVHPNQEPVAPQRNRKSNLVVCLIVACLYAAFAYPTRWIRRMPTDPLERAHALLKYTPVCDGHIDLPILVREYFYNQLDKVDLRQAFKGQVDIPRLRRGHTGGFFHSVFVPCNEDMGEGYPRDNGGNFTTPSFRVRDTLEQIDVAKLIIDQYDDVFELTLTADAWQKAMRRGKVGGMLGVEGGHQLGSSLGVLRQYAELGVRYVTLSHTCNNAVADTCGYDGVEAVKPRWNGLSPWGHLVVQEMNRLGVMVDVSHTSPKTASDALSFSRAPVIFSHSNARGQHFSVRNVPDSILRRIGRLNGHRPSGDLRLDGEKGLGWGNDTGEVDKPIPGGDALVMLNFSPAFLAPNNTANVNSVADHADYIGRLTGRAHVGIGSDFDGIQNVPQGLEDVSRYPHLFAELYRRGWSDRELEGLANRNLMRVLKKVEKVKHQLRHERPRNDNFPGRTDMHRHW